MIASYLEKIRYVQMLCYGILSGSASVYAFWHIDWWTNQYFMYNIQQRKIWLGEEHLMRVERGGKGVSHVTTCKFFGMKIVLNMFLVVVRFGCCHTSETHDKCGCMCSRVFIGSHPYACSICTYLRSSRVELILENPSSHKIFGHKSFKSLKHGNPSHTMTYAPR